MAVPEMSELDLVYDDLRQAQARIEALEAALREIETICIESAGDCRKRMGTRVGNTIVAARAALEGK